jgi:hypothetical protein
MQVLLRILLPSLAQSLLFVLLLLLLLQASHGRGAPPDPGPVHCSDGHGGMASLLLVLLMYCCCC